MSTEPPATPDPDRLDGYEPGELPPTDPLKDPLFLDAARAWAGQETAAGRMDNFDGFMNELTGLGDPTQDKSFGGLNGLKMRVTLLSGQDCQNRWRGSDLGGRVIETVPNEMIREWYDLQIQPSDDGEEKAKADRWDAEGGTLGGHIVRQLERAEARGDRDTARVLRLVLDAAPPFGQPGGLQPPIPAAGPKPLELPEDDGTEMAEALMKRLQELGVKERFREALCFTRAYGGAGILLGVDDGRPMVEPLDETKIKSISHLTTFRGGWDGELIAWSYYNDMSKKDFGTPRIYMLRNLGVPITSGPAPGERQKIEMLPTSYALGAQGSLITWVHHSRLLVFPGQAVSREARIQMRGWGDSIFTRINEVLSQYGQTWSGISNLMQDWAQGVFKMNGLAKLLAANDPATTGTVARRLLAIQMSRSIARMMLIDADGEEFKREITPLSGLSDVIEQFSLRLAAAADMPLSKLMGQTKGGLGDAGNTDSRNWYDQIGGKQEEQVVPLLHRAIRLVMLSGDGPTKKKEPKKWIVFPRPLWKPTEAEQADLRSKQMTTDTGYITAQVLTPEEVAASRFGGAKYSTDTVIDFAGRKKAAAIADKAKKKLESAKKTPPPGGGGGGPAGAPGADPAAGPASGADKGGKAAVVLRLEHQPEKTGPAAAPGAARGDGSPDQPRVPAGQPGGGQFAAAGGESSGSSSAAAPAPGGTDHPSALSKFEQARGSYQAAAQQRREAVATRHGVDPNNLHQHPEAWRQWKREEKPFREQQLALERTIGTDDLEELNPSHASAAKAAAPLPVGRKWVDHVEGTPLPKEGGTMAVHFKGFVANPDGSPKETGTPTPERAALHAKIEASYLDHVASTPPGAQPVAILTMGGTASGKSSMMRAAKIPEDKFVKVDSDGIKEQLPEYDHLIDRDKSRGASARDGAAIVHEESSYVAKQVRDRAITDRKNLIFDGTGKNAGAYRQLIDRLHANGYQVTVMMTDLSVDKGLARAQKRAEGSGRWVPEDFVREAYNTIPKNFDGIARAADGFGLYDNHGSMARAVWTKTGNTEVVHDRAYLDKFHAGKERG